MKSFTRVLIVDDENIFRSTLRNLFSWEDEGFLLVGFAENGYQALSLLDVTLPQIVITDIAMPVMDGIELLKEIEKRNALPQYREHPIGAIVLSGFETFSYVRDAMRRGAFDYLLKSELTRETVLLCLHNLIACMPQSQGTDPLNFTQFCSNLLHHSYTSLPFIQESLRGYGLSLDPTAQLFLIQSFCSDKTELSIQSADARRVLSQQLAFMPAAVFLHEEACLIFGEMACLSSVLFSLEGITEECPALYWGVCRDVPGILQLSAVISPLRQISDQYFYAPTRDIFSCSDNITYGLPPSISPSNIQNAVLQSDYQAVSFILGDYLNTCSRLKADPYAVRKNCEHAVYLLILAAEKGLGNPSALSLKKIEYFQRIEASSSIDELCDVLEDILSSITAWDSPHIEGSQALLGQIETFISENYMHPLHLSDLAGHVHLSYHYLSRILKSAYGKTFNDYLNRVRVQAAQKLLVSTDMSLSDIAEKVGFSNQSYFGKIFKKSTGFSPRLFRIQHSHVASL